MLPTDPKSWLALCKPIHSESRSHMGTRFEGASNDADYHGIPCGRNMPAISSGRTFDGLGYASGAFLSLSTA